MRFCENRREKSLGLLTQNFVKLFLTTNMEMISLDEAARLLLGDGDSSQMRNNAAKVRRLYDIANVLSSMNLIEKTQHAESRKPAFRWLGVNVKPDLTVAMAPPSKQNKRAFGIDITNTDFKRSKVLFPADGKQRKVRNRSDDLKECNLTAQRQLQGSKSCVFGPFCPGAAKGEKETEAMGEQGALDWDVVAASFRPQYHNQALNDLFAHYVEAWKSWYFELAQGGSTFNDPAILDQLIPISNRCR
ncbi:hypothetical protein Taro_055815 [Colocasia esculenta]|uniref:E2F/DP family winged-helix DNA-binding domain-containing protein n=1 Tax=Colocasia esculenta TaxID=4460 RepID=A0A843XRX4_COLES|nr:hypothetical protein [Colocasia esculenta]